MLCGASSAVHPLRTTPAGTSSASPSSAPSPLLSPLPHGTLRRPSPHCVTLPTRMLARVAERVSLHPPPSSASFLPPCSPPSPLSALPLSTLSQSLFDPAWMRWRRRKSIPLPVSTLRSTHPCRRTQRICCRCSTRALSSEHTEVQQESHSLRRPLALLPHGAPSLLATGLHWMMADTPLAPSDALLRLTTPSAEHACLSLSFGHRRAEAALCPRCHRPLCTAGRRAAGGVGVTFRTDEHIIRGHPLGGHRRTCAACDCATRQMPTRPLSAALCARWCPLLHRTSTHPLHPIVPHPPPPLSLSPPLSPPSAHLPPWKKKERKKSSAPSAHVWMSERRTRRRRRSKRACSVCAYVPRTPSTHRLKLPCSPLRCTRTQDERRAASHHSVS